MSAVDSGFAVFGERETFALECRLMDQPDRRGVPAASLNSWGEWRLWVGGLNLCEHEIRSSGFGVGPGCVRWFLAPLFRWLIETWTPLLHETRLPGAVWGDTRPRWSRLAYLSMLETVGDDPVLFGPWRDWATRHALRSASEGGIVPDAFFHRVGDAIEISWGDRIQPGGEDVDFLTEDGVARVPVETVGTVFRDAIDWFLQAGQIRSSEWAGDLIVGWKQVCAGENGETQLAWYLDAAPRPGQLTDTFIAAFANIGRTAPSNDGLWWAPLSPEIAMFGALSPSVSADAATTLLSEYFLAQTNKPESDRLKDLVSDEPAWSVTSPWTAGYSLARDILEDADPDPNSSSTDVKRLLDDLGIVVRDVRLGENGPRGVAFAGSGVQPTILVNLDSPFNKRQGRRFTMMHELCHILFDRPRARALAHSSTPWAPPAIEQRANAFAAMLLMPPSRAARPAAADIKELSRKIDELAKRLKVGQVALKRHLANVGEINAVERERLFESG